VSTTAEPTSIVHLVRHGRVENPAGVIYGRLPGYHLSERGRKQAEAAAAHLADRAIAEVYASPLERAQETAQTIARLHGLEVVTDERLIESGTTLEGAGRNVMAFVKSPKLWWKMRNPLRPSWGESYTEIRARMIEAIDDAIATHAGKEVVLVSHQSPIREAVRVLNRRRRPTISGLTTPCHTGSVTTVMLAEDKRVLETAYYRPEV
jgi:broad specificity phosphatase PhoE